MFDFSNSLNQRRRPTQRILTSWVASLLIHLVLILVPIEFPQLLRGSRIYGFRPLSAIANLLGAKSEDKDDNWRTVTVLRSPMMAPSAATLRKYLRDLDKKGSGPPPVTARWGDEQKAALENEPPVPKIRKEPNASTVFPPPSGAIAGQTDTGSPSGSSADDSESPNLHSTILRADAGGEKEKTVDLPPLSSASKPEVALNTAPSRIPSGIKPSSNTPKESVQVFEDEQKAIRSPESGFFDTKGFPLGEYANAIKERIKGNWYIPSNLRNSQGHTTIIFYIGKDGRFTNARIEPSASSGNTSLDLAALKAIMDSNPFPPLPKGFPGDHVGAKFVLSYNEP
jgi:TonB family protein